MPKPHIHSDYDVKKYGGVASDYNHIHELLDSSKATIADGRHRALTHNAWFIGTILPRIFGETFVNSDGKTVSTRDIGENHCMMDYGWKFIPSAQDWLEGIPWQDWHNNGRGEPPPSAREIFKARADVMKMKD